MAAPPQADEPAAEAHLQMDQKHKQVRRWLEGIFAGGEIPDYEINSQTVDFLHSLASQSEGRERQTELLIADLEQKTPEYTAEATRLQSVMEWLGYHTKDLSPATQGYIKTLAGVATALGLKDCSDTSLCLALTELSQQRAVERAEVEEAVGEVERLQEDVRLALLRNASHKRVLHDLEEHTQVRAPLLAKQKRESEFLQQKTRQYHKLVSSMKEELKQSGYEPGLSHGSLQQCAKEIEELQSQLVPLKSQLASYQDLPPDLDLAKVKLEEARIELARLEAEVTRTIDLVHAEK